MQVNRINQSNQQTNFKGAYFKVANLCWSTHSGFDVSADYIMDMFVKTPQKKCLLLQAKDLLLKIDFDQWAKRGSKPADLPVILTDKEVAKFEELKDSESQREFLNRLLRFIGCKYEQDLTIVPVENDVFLNHI